MSSVCACVFIQYFEVAWVYLFIGFHAACHFIPFKNIAFDPPSSFSSLQRRALCSTAFHHGDQVLQHERATLPHEESTTAAVENNTGQCVTVMVVACNANKSISVHVCIFVLLFFFFFNKTSFTNTQRPLHYLDLAGTWLGLILLS